MGACGINENAWKHHKSTFPKKDSAMCLKTLNFWFNTIRFWIKKVDQLLVNFYRMKPHINAKF